MRRLVAALALTFCVFFVLGYTWAEKTQTIKLSIHQDDTMRFYVIAIVPNVTEEPRWLHVFICAAEMDDTSVQCIQGGWEAMSSREPRTDRRDNTIPFGRYVPRGTKLILAELTDRESKVLATGRKVVLR